MSATAQVFAAIQDWQTAGGSPDTAAELALRLADGDEQAARLLLAEAAQMWQTVTASAAQPFRSGEDGADIGPAHGRPRGETGRVMA